MPKISQLTSAIENAITVNEFVAEGKVEDFVFHIRHKRLTMSVLNEVNNIREKISEENQKLADEKAKAKAKNSVKSFGVNKNIYASQLAFLVEHTDIESDAGEIMPPTVETFESLPVSTLSQLFDGILKTTLPEKKLLKNSSSGMSPEETSDALQAD